MLNSVEVYRAAMRLRDNLKCCAELAIEHGETVSWNRERREGFLPKFPDESDIILLDCRDNSAERRRISECYEYVLDTMIVLLQQFDPEGLSKALLLK